MSTLAYNDSTRNRMHISKKIIDTKVKFPPPLFDRLIDLVATVPGRPGNPHHHIALNAVLEMIARNTSITESDILSLQKTFEEGTIFLRKRSWLYRNRATLEQRIRTILSGLSVGSQGISQHYVDDLVSIVLRSSSKDGRTSPHNTLRMLETVITFLKEYGITSPGIISTIIDNGARAMPTDGYHHFKLEIDRLEHPEKYLPPSTGGC